MLVYNPCKISRIRIRTKFLRIQNTAFCCQYYYSDFSPVIQLFPSFLFDIYAQSLPFFLSLCFIFYFYSPTQVLETADSGDEKAITAMGLLNTMETILAVMEEKPEVNPLTFSFSVVFLSPFLWILRLSQEFI